MLDMLKTRKEELEAKGKKGFTLMEMLIVIAIIAILIAIAIPMFTSQLNAARVATDEANIRSGYASVAADGMLNNLKDSAGTAANVVYLKKDASWTTNANDANVYTTQGDNDAAVTIGTSALTWDPGKKVQYTYNPTSATVEIAII